MVADSETFLVGENVANKDVVKLNRVTFSIEGFCEWAGYTNGISVETGTTSTQPLTYNFELGEMDKLLGIHVQIGDGLPQVTWRPVEGAIFSLSIKDDKSQYGGLEDAIEDIYSLSDLFSLLIGHRVGVEDIRLYDFDRRLEYQYFIRGAITKEGEGKRKSRRMFTKLRDIKYSHFEGILKKWVRLKGRNDYILREFLDTQSREDVAANFLSYARFVEAFHGNICAAEPFDDKLIKGINDKIENLVEQEVTRFVEQEALQVKKRYSDSLISINSHTFQEKLELSFESDKFLPKDIKTELSITPEFATRVKRIRNDLTHLNKNVRDIKDLSDISERLKVVTYVIIFKSIGLTNELLSKQLQGIWRYFLV